MEINKISIKIKDLTDGYVNDSEIDIEEPVMAYGGKLCVRPAFQRSFVYKKPQENAVIDTALRGFPLNTMYWVDNGDGTYDCLDGQQRTISLCNFVDGITSYEGTAAGEINEGRHIYLNNLKRTNPDLMESFLNYELDVYICKGTKAEQLSWFKTINIAGEELSDQELRNANYVSPWLTDAKKYFSRANEGGKKCPAEQIGCNFTKANANRQELLERVIAWYAGEKTDEAICEYMSNHVNDENAKELWNYYNEVIDWVKDLFPGVDDKALQTVEWGYLYNNYCTDEFDPDEIDEIYNQLIEAKATGELTSSKGKILEYCITRDESLLKNRAFKDTQRTTLYNRQKGICPDCGNHFEKKDMEAHHIVPWYNGGTTDLDNGVMLCKECHRQRHL